MASIDDGLHAAYTFDAGALQFCPILLRRKLHRASYLDRIARSSCAERRHCKTGYLSIPPWPARKS